MFVQVMSEISELTRKIHQSMFQSSCNEVSAYVKSILQIIYKNAGKLTEENKTVYLDSTDSECDESNDSALNLAKCRKIRKQEWDSLAKNFPMFEVPEMHYVQSCSNIVQQLFDKLCSEFIENPGDSDLDHFPQRSFGGMILEKNQDIIDALNFKAEEIYVDLIN